MGAHRIAVDMMDKASALPTYPQRQQQKQPTDFTIGLKASTRLHDEGKYLTTSESIKPDDPLTRIDFIKLRFRNEHIISSGRQHRDRRCR
jgi:hypothetical protein